MGKASVDSITNDSQARRDQLRSELWAGSIGRKNNAERRSVLSSFKVVNLDKSQHTALAAERLVCGGHGVHGDLVGTTDGSRRLLEMRGILVPIEQIIYALRLLIGDSVRCGKYLFNPSP
jgi:hypothetical protein